MKFGILTGGGDSPAINAATRAVVLAAFELGHEVVGIRDGWLGAIKNRTFKMTAAHVSGILDESGTVLCTSRTNPFKIKDGEKSVLATLKKNKIDFLIAIGGDDTLGVAHRLAPHGLKAVGIPQTIDNDIGETDYSIGFDTSLNFVMEAIDRLRTTAHAHSRVIVVEVMGRDAGWLTLLGGMAGGADAMLIPEAPFCLDKLCVNLKTLHKQGKRFAVIAVAEGAKPDDASEQFSKIGEVDAFGHTILGGIADWLAKEIKQRTGYETRSAILGHLQRGGVPTAFDRNLATCFGIAAVNAALEGKHDVMVAIKGHNFITVPLEKALKKNRRVDMNTLSESRFFLQMAMRDLK